MDDKIDKITLFNSPLESGLRTLFILAKVYPRSLDTQRLIYYNYLALHTGDFSEEVESLHPAIPNRSCQIIIQREVIQEGLHLLQAKELIAIKYNKTGVNFLANKSAINFIEYFRSEYSQELINRIDLVIKKFNNLTDKQLDSFIKNNLTNWGSEFIEETHSS
jgi:hypothetical protein